MGYPSDEEFERARENRQPPGLRAPTVHAVNGFACRARCGEWLHPGPTSGTTTPPSITHTGNEEATKASVTCAACHGKRIDIPTPLPAPPAHTTKLVGDANDPIHFPLSDGNTVCGVKVAGSNVRIASTVSAFIDARGAGYACASCVSGSTVRYEKKPEPHHLAPVDSSDKHALCGAEVAPTDLWTSPGDITDLHYLRSQYGVNCEKCLALHAKPKGTLTIEKIDMAKGPDHTALVVYKGPNEIIDAMKLSPDVTVKTVDLKTDAGKALQKIMETGVTLDLKTTPRSLPELATALARVSDTIFENTILPGGKTVRENSIIEEAIARARSFMFPHGGLRPDTEAHLRRLLIEGKGVWLKKPKGSGRTTARALHYLISGQNPDVLPNHLNEKLPNEREAILRAAAFITTPPVPKPATPEAVPPALAAALADDPHTLCETCHHTRELHPKGGACAHVFGCATACAKFVPMPPKGLTVEQAEAAKAEFEKVYPEAGKLPAEPAAASEGLKPGMGTIHYLDVEKKAGRVCKAGGCTDTKIAARGLCLKHYGEERGITDDVVNAIDAGEERAREEGRTVPFGGACGTCHATLRADGYCPECRGHVLGARKPEEVAPTNPPADAPRPSVEPEGASVVTKLPEGEKLAEALHELAADHGFPATAPPKPLMVHLVGEAASDMGFAFCGRPIADFLRRGDEKTTSLAATTCGECWNAHKRTRGIKDEDEAFCEPRSDAPEVELPTLTVGAVVNAGHAIMVAHGEPFHESTKAHLRTLAAHGPKAELMGQASGRTTARALYSIITGKAYVYGPNEDRAVAEAIRLLTLPEDPTSIVTDAGPMVFVNSTMLAMADSLAGQAREMADEDDPRSFKRARLLRAAAKLMEAYAEVAEIEGINRVRG